jgi:hypothetical protein
VIDVFFRIIMLIDRAAATTIGFLLPTGGVKCSQNWKTG